MLFAIREPSEDPHFLGLGELMLHGLTTTTPGPFLPRASLVESMPTSAIAYQPSRGPSGAAEP